MLDPDEYTSTQYICTQVELTRLDPVAAGAICLDDGFVVRTGLDTNGDGVLEDSEATSTTYACDLARTIDGDVTIESEADAAAIQDVATITGALTVSAPDSFDLSLPHLYHVDSFFCGTARACQLQSLDLPMLNVVDHFFEIHGDETHTVSLPLGSLVLPRLTTAYGFTVSTADALARVDLPAFSPASGMQFYDSPNLVSIDIPAYTSGNLDIVGVPLLTHLSILNVATGRVTISQTSLTELAAPVLTNGSVVLDASPVTTVSLPLLTTVTDQLSIGGTNVVELSFPSLTSVNDLEIHNSQLTTLSAPQLVAVTTFDVGQNPQLPACQVAALWQQVGRGSLNADMDGNDATATCP